MSLYYNNSSGGTFILVYLPFQPQQAKSANTRPGVPYLRTIMDNRIFNVNGSGEQHLLATLRLAFMQDGASTRCKGWRLTKNGLVLAWYVDKDTVPFPASTGMTADEVLPMVLSWLAGDDAKAVPMEGWDSNASHDGKNSLGWRVFCEDWGHVAGCTNAICAVKPAYLWHGK